MGKEAKGMGWGEGRKIHCNVKRMRPWKSHTARRWMERIGRASHQSMAKIMVLVHHGIGLDEDGPSINPSTVPGEREEHGTGNKGACRAEVPPNLPRRVRRQNGPPPALTMPRWAICILECVF